MFDGGSQDLGGPGRHTVYVGAEGAGVGRCNVALTVPCDLTVTTTGAGGATDTFAASLKSIAGATRCTVSLDGAAARALDSCTSLGATFTGADLGGPGPHTLAVSVEDAQGPVGTCHAKYSVN
jgi:hypothetical protein